MSTRKKSAKKNNGPVVLHVHDGELSSITVDLDGKTYEFSDACDDEGNDTRGDETSLGGFKIVETSYKGREEGTLIEMIKEVARHPKVMYYSGRDEDGDQVWRVWVLCRDCDNYREAMREIGEAQLAKQEEELKIKRKLVSKVRIHRLDPKGEFDRAPEDSYFDYREKTFLKLYESDVNALDGSDTDLILKMVEKSGKDSPPADVTFITTGELRGRFCFRKPETALVLLRGLAITAREKYIAERIEHARKGNSDSRTREVLWFTEDEYADFSRKLWAARREFLIKP